MGSYLYHLNPYVHLAIHVWAGKKLFGCSTAASQQQMALNFELVVSDQLFSVVLAIYK
jgi:hypothetical protein